MVLVLIKALRAVNGQSANRTPTRSTSRFLSLHGDSGQGQSECSPESPGGCDRFAFLFGDATSETECLSLLSPSLPIPRLLL